MYISLWIEGIKVSDEVGKFYHYLGIILRSGLADKEIYSFRRLM